MSKTIATQKAVDEAAQALLQEGIEPSIILIKRRIGGGSYSSIQKCFDIWKQQREEIENAAVDLPEDLTLKAIQFVTTLWGMASKESKSRAQTEINVIKKESDHMQSELREARDEIARLEGIESDLTEKISGLAEKIRILEISEAQARALVSRLENSEHELKECRSKLDAAQETIANQSLTIGELTGEAKALRNQISHFKTTDA